MEVSTGSFAKTTSLFLCEFTLFSDVVFFFVEVNWWLPFLGSVYDEMIVIVFFLLVYQVEIRKK